MCEQGLPEAVQVQVVRVKVQQGLLGVSGAVGLQDGGGGGDDRGLAGWVDGLELELGAHPEAAVRPRVGHDLHLNRRDEGEVGLALACWFFSGGHWSSMHSDVRKKITIIGRCKTACFTVGPVAWES